MTKKILSGIALVAGLMSCTEDFTNWASPQSNDGKDAAQVLQMTVTPAVNTIDFAEVTSETIKLFSTSLTADQASEYTVDISGEGVEEKTSITADEAGNVQTADLKGAVSYLYGAAPEARTLTIGISTVATNVTADGNVKVKRVATPYTLTAKLDAPYIAPNYYVVGGSKSWDSSKEQKFSHSGANVYDDPVFTIVIDAAASGDTWFAIGDDEGVEAIANNDWTKLFGIVGGNNTATSGKLDYRYNLGADNTFCVPAGPKKIKVEINMLERTFKIETISIANAYYLIGGPGEWNNSKAQKFSHSDKDVFDDPVFTYVFEGTGGDMWFAFGDEEAIDAVGANDWTKLFGTTGASEDFSGSFDRRYNLDGDHSFHVDGLAKKYRFTINMAEMTYEIKAINFAEYIWEAGVNNDWGAIEQPLYCADGNGLYTGFFYAQDADWSDGKGAFKFTGAFNDWGQGNYGTGTIADDGLSGTLIDDGGSGNVLATPGFYKATVNLAEMTYVLTPIAGIGLIGPAQAGGWSDDTDLTYNPDTRAWEGTLELAADEFKFRANDAWDINWGGELNNLTQNGANLKVEKAGKYFIQFFPLCETKSYATITAVD